MTDDAMKLEQRKKFIIICPEGTETRYWAELWQYRELIIQFAWRDILLRYRQTIFGIVWTVGRTALPLIVLVLVFGRLAKLPSENCPYPLFVFAGLIPWQFISSCLSSIVTGLVANSHLIKKVYFPRLVIPLGTLTSCFIDIIVSLCLFLALMYWYSWPFNSAIFFMPLFLLLLICLVLGSGLLLSSIAVSYRDVIHLLPFMIQFGLYLSPVGYGTHLVPNCLKYYYICNPLVGIIDGIRWSLLGIEPYWPGVFSSACMAILLLGSGIVIFRKQEQTFADII